MKRWASILVAAVVAFGFLTAIFMMWPAESLWILVPALTIPFIVWLFTTFKYPVESKRVVAIYIFALAGQMIHMAEEYVRGFSTSFQHLFDTEPWPERQFLLIAVFLGVTIYLLGAGGMLLGSRAANYLAWFYVLGLGLANSIAHIVLSFIEGGAFPGLYTTPLHLALSVWLIVALLREYRRLRDKYEGSGTGTALPLPRTVI